MTITPAQPPGPHRPPSGQADFDAHVRAMTAWHFDDRTGSPFWLARRAQLGFDPLTDVTGAADLVRFPDVSRELRTTPAADLIPRGAAPGQVFRVYESGGTTGAPKRIVDGAYRSRMGVWTRQRLTDHGVPETGDWLHLGPTGPHVVAFDTSRYAEPAGGLCYTVDLDPRWVKRLLGSGRQQEADDYIDHLLDQAREILLSQPVRVLSTTPPLIEAICARPDLYELVASRIEAVIWAGTSFSPESLRLVQEDFFPTARLVGIYGNSLMGVAPQRVRTPEDTHPCVFEPFAETTRLDLVDEDGRQVGYGERGRVRVNLVSEEMFLPNVLERDTAVRVRPSSDGGVDGLAEVASVATYEDADVVEGVY
ncbi:phenazine biosynthesis protein [Streptomyces xanthochromogenes]|uniref:phenazine biosynthesis protein n=1 Tax=Streptomyces xanthochromogenes TaxID=67384 RepID=UPI003422D972